ncbi:hypothetical protein MTO96_022901 [Rhipicephalus appendiculatus]
MDRICCCLRNAAGVGRETAQEDSMCINNTQNILVISTPSEDRARRYGAIIKLRIAVLHAKRMGNTDDVIVLFEGFHVPRYVMYGAMLVKCTLYRKHIDVCYCCGRLGHRADVCPNPKDKVCRGCGSKNPAQDHRCEVECQLCGKDHPTGDKSCKARYKIPYVVRRRRWERARREEEARAACAEACHNYKEFSGFRNSDHKESMSEKSDKNTNKQDSRHGPERDRSGSFPRLTRGKSRVRSGVPVQEQIEIKAEVQFESYPSGRRQQRSGELCKCGLRHCFSDSCYGVRFRTGNVAD